MTCVCPRPSSLPCLSLICPSLPPSTQVQKEVGERLHGAAARGSVCHVQQGREEGVQGPSCVVSMMSRNASLLSTSLMSFCASCFAPTLVCVCTMASLTQLTASAIPSSLPAEWQGACCNGNGYLTFTICIPGACVCNFAACF